MPDPIFTNMTITFFTLDDDKDDNTRLEIWINKVGEHEAAYRDIHNDKFGNGSTKVFDVPPKSNPLLRSEVPGSWIQLRIKPIGNDTWKFRFDAVLRFTDGSTITKSVGPTALDQDARQGNYPI